jgi:hypothetical protein
MRGDAGTFVRLPVLAYFRFSIFEFIAESVFWHLGESHYLGATSLDTTNLAAEQAPLK